MSNGLDRVRETLLRYSAGQVWPEVLKEWSVTGGFIDTHYGKQICALCDNESLCYQFQITNAFTHYSLRVGSACVNRVVPLYRDGRELFDKEKDAEVQKIMAAASATTQQERAKAVLAELKIKIPDIFSDPIWEAHLDIGYSASQLKMIAVLCKNHRIPFYSGDFRINTRKANVISQIRSLEPWQYNNLRDAIPESRHALFDTWFAQKKQPSAN